MKKEQEVPAKACAAYELAEEDVAKVAGGMARIGSSEYHCRKCNKDFSDAGTYFEHMKMVHGG